MASGVPPEVMTAEPRVISGRESVRLRPTMYIGSTGRSGLYHLLRYAVDGVVTHYHDLGHPLARIVVYLGREGDVTITGHGMPMPADAFDRGDRLFARELEILGVGSPIGLFVVNALSSRLVACVRSASGTWLRLAFAQGIGQERSILPGQVDERAHVALRYWPDFTILKRGVCDPHRAASILGTIRSGTPGFDVDILDQRSRRFTGAQILE